jgi:hypothetical protein
MNRPRRPGKSIVSYREDSSTQELQYSSDDNRIVNEEKEDPKREETTYTSDGEDILQCSSDECSDTDEEEDDEKSKKANVSEGRKERKSPLSWYYYSYLTFRTNTKKLVLSCIDSLGPDVALPEPIVLAGNTRSFKPNSVEHRLVAFQKLSQRHAYIAKIRRQGWSNSFYCNITSFAEGSILYDYNASLSVYSSWIEETKSGITFHCMYALHNFLVGGLHANTVLLDANNERHVICNPRCYALPHEQVLVNAACPFGNAATNLKGTCHICSQLSSKIIRDVLFSSGGRSIKTLIWLKLKSIKKKEVNGHEVSDLQIQQALLRAYDSKIIQGSGFVFVIQFVRCLYSII